MSAALAQANRLAARWVPAVAGLLILAVRDVGTAALLAVAVVGGIGLTAPVPIPAPLRRRAGGIALALGCGGFAVLVVRGMMTAPPASGGGRAMAVAALAAIAEEAFFRRYLYARIERYHAASAVAVTALAFALVHIGAYGTGSFSINFAAGLLFGWQRWASGGWGAPAATHALANVVQYL